MLISRHTSLSAHPSLRSLCYRFAHPFEDIEVKQNAPELLERILRSKRKKIMIGSGSMCDPYQPCEEKLMLTNSYEYNRQIYLKISY